MVTPIVNQRSCQHMLERCKRTSVGTATRRPQQRRPGSYGIGPKVGPGHDLIMVRRDAHGGLNIVDDHFTYHSCRNPEDPAVEAEVRKERRIPRRGSAALCQTLLTRQASIIGHTKSRRVPLRMAFLAK